MGISGIENKGVSTNSIISGSGNNGSRGKIPDSLLDVRLRMHAKRLIHKVPDFKTMIAIWKKDYNIIIAEQSEKEWSYVQKNKDRINAMATSMVDSMELEVAPISTEILTNSLVQITRENVKRLKQVTQVEKNLLNSIDTKIEAYKIVGISKEDYMNSKPEERKEYNSKAKMEFDAQKFKAGILKDISGIGKNTNDSMLSAIDKADKINKRNEKFQLLKQHFDKTALPEKSTETDDKDVEILGDVAIDDNKLAKMRQWVEDNE